MANLCMKMRSMSLTIIEMQVRTTMRHHFTPVRMAIIQKLSVLVRMWRKGPLTLLVRVYTGAVTVQNDMKAPEKLRNRTTSNRTPGYLSKGNENRIMTRYTHSHIHYSISHNGQVTETA